MAQFDVQHVDSICQSDLLEHLDIRLAVPLMPCERAPAAEQGLNPIFVIDGREQVMVTQFAAAIPEQELGKVAMSLRRQSFAIAATLGVLISGV